MRLATPSTAGLCYVVLAALAVTGEQNTLRALALSCVLTLLNPTLAPVPTSGMLGRFLVITAAGLSSFLRWPGLRGGLEVSVPVVASLGVGLAIGLHSLLFSPIPILSLLKAGSWTFAITSVVAAWCRLTPEQRKGAQTELYGLLVGVLLVSLPLVGLPQGYALNEKGLQGIFNHPQVFGPTMSLLAAWALTRLFSQPRPQWHLIGTWGLAALMIVLSEARTAGVAMLVGAFLGLVTVSLLSGRRLVDALPAIRSARLYIVLLVGSLLVVANSATLGQRLTEFIAKRNQTDSLVAAYESSRGQMIERMWERIQERPFTGSGFGLASDTDATNVVYDETTGLPISAAAEKGVLPLAVLEELGILGFAWVALWMWGVLRRSARAGPEALALVVTVLATNLGEATFFSPGGLGLLYLVCVGWGATGPSVGSVGHAFPELWEQS
jgi:hypothetical protein